MKNHILAIWLIIITFSASAQTKFGDNKGTINGSAVVEIESTNKGVLVPRVSLTSTTTWGLATTTPVNGMMLYNTNAAMTGTAAAPTLIAVVGMYYWDGSKWVGMSGLQTDGSYWALKGNTGTTAPTQTGTAAGTANYWGTADAKNLAVGTNATTRAIFDQNGSLYGGSGTYDATQNPLASLVWGSGNKDSANYTLVSGENNSIATSATHNAVFGYNNQVRSGAANVISGGQNIVNSANNAVVGFQNTVNSYENSVSGNGNIVDGYRNNVSGWANRLSANAYQSAVFGDHNIDSSYSTLIAGSTNTLASTGQLSVMGGSQNYLSGVTSVVFGANNKDSANYTSLTGSYNSIGASGSNATVSGGAFNYANAIHSFIGAGVQNDVNTGGFSAIIGGIQDTVSGGLSVALGGLVNSVSGYRNVVSGAYNRVVSSNTANGNLATDNLITGSNNYLLDATSSIIAGRLDSISGASAGSSLVLGYNNKTTNNLNVVFGQYNKSAGANILVSGFNNVIDGIVKESAVFGSGNNVSSNDPTQSNTFVSGAGNNVKADFGLTIGRNNTNLGYDNIVLGYHANAGSFTGCAVLNDASLTSDLLSTANFSFSSRYANGYRLFTNGTMTTGVSLAAGGTSWASISDIRSKDNIRNISYGLDAVLALRPAIYNYKGTKNSSLGFIAQEVKAVVPEVVEQTTMGPDKDYLAVKYTELIPVLTRAIQELNKKLVTLEAENARLTSGESLIMQLAEQVSKLQQQIEAMATQQRVEKISK